MRRLATAGAILLPLAAGFADPAAAQATKGFLQPIGPIAEAQRTELIWASVITLAAILPVLIGTPIILWRYRRVNTKAAYRPAWHFDTKLEILMWGVPTLIIIALSIWLTQATFRTDPYRVIDEEYAEGFDMGPLGEQVTVDVVGLDWKWLYLYPEAGIASVGDLVIPVQSPVTMRLTSDTVMQSYFASGLAGQIYAMAGMVTRLNMIATEEGESLAENTQYNGEAFARQRGAVKAVTPDQYEAWVATARGAPVLDAAAYARLAQSGDVEQAKRDLGREGVGPLLFRLDENALFDRIVGRYRNGQPVEPHQQPGSPSYDPEAALPPSLAQIFPDAFCGSGPRLAAAILPNEV